MSATFGSVVFAQSQVVDDIQDLAMFQDNGFTYLPDLLEDLPPSLEESQLSSEASSVLGEDLCAAVAYDNLSSVRRTTESSACKTWVWPTSTASTSGTSYYSCCGRPLNGPSTNIPLFIVDSKCNSVLCTNDTVDEESDSPLHLNNSYSSSTYYHNSPISSYYTTSNSSPHYTSSDNGYVSCTDSSSSLSPFSLNQFQWIDNLVLEARKEIQTEKRKATTKSLKRKLSSEQVFPLSTDCTKIKCSKKNSLSGMSFSDIARRKKEQNRIAAQRYRNKQKAVEKAESEEMKYLKERNEFLRAESDRLEKEIEEIKNNILIFMH